MSRSKPNNQSGPVTGRLQMVEIARAAGVSVSTVSRALAGSGLISPETRARIGRLARALIEDRDPTFVPQPREDKPTISVVLPYDACNAQDLNDPMFLSLLGSIADAITNHGAEMLFSRVPCERLEEVVHAVVEGRALGVLVIGQWQQHDQLNKLALRGVPIVVWGAQLPGQLYCSVGSDNFQGGLAMTRHLLHRNCRRILFVGDTRLPEVALRYEGYASGLKERRMTLDPDRVLQVPFRADAARPDIGARCDAAMDFDGVFAASDLLAQTVIEELRARGVRVPHDVRVAGYDDVALAQLNRPTISTVRQGIAQAGGVMVRSLMALYRGMPVASTVLPTHIVARESTAVQA